MITPNTAEASYVAPIAASARTHIANGCYSRAAESQIVVMPPAVQNDPMPLRLRERR